ncbi:MBL fold metallo-hydrolase [Candidatus Woesearchaeota archaeon]|nr:MBL fold metallo-hydrolase [Candidatus Woesearchaeota archaeon]
MRLIFHGGAGEVGRSCIELASRRHRLLLDCGLKLTPHGTKYPVGLENVEDIDAVFLSHAHLDHCGALPLLDHQGMNCPIFATKTTKALTRMMLRDSFKIGRINHQHLGYDELDVMKVLSCMSRVKVNNQGSIGDVKYEFFDAGHIPGSASVFVNVDGTKVLYTGDLNNIDTLLHSAARTDFPEVDILICESTYGDREHPSRSDVEKKFLAEIDKTLADGGTPIIPVFALGRSQEIAMLLVKQKFGVPIFFDGMSREASKIILSNPSSVRDPKLLSLAMNKVHAVKGHKDRMSAIRKQSIIVTTSGMLTGGPIMTYLKYLHADPKNSILLTGYQAEGTNGRLLLEEGNIFIDGELKKVRCNVKHFDFSAHAGKSQLKDIVRVAKPKNVFFVHGEKKSVSELHDWASALNMRSFAPDIGDVVDI